MSSSAEEKVVPDKAGPPVILIGPPGFAKVPDASGLMRCFGCTRVLDEWDGKTRLQPGDLAFTNMSLVQLERVCATHVVPTDTRIRWAPWVALNFDISLL